MCFNIKKLYSYGISSGRKRKANESNVFERKYVEPVEKKRKISSLILGDSAEAKGNFDGATYGPRPIIKRKKRISINPKVYVRPIPNRYEMKKGLTSDSNNKAFFDYTGVTRDNYTPRQKKTVSRRFTGSSSRVNSLTSNQLLALQQTLVNSEYGNHFLQSYEIKRGHLIIRDNELGNKPLILHFFNGWCETVTPSIRDYYQSFNGMNINIVFIMCDHYASHRLEQYKSAFHHCFYISYDGKILELLKKYEITKYPAIKVVNPNGNPIDDGAEAKMKFGRSSAEKLVDDWKKAL